MNGYTRNKLSIGEVPIVLYASISDHVRANGMLSSTDIVPVPGNLATLYSIRLVN